MHDDDLLPSLGQPQRHPPILLFASYTEIASGSRNTVVARRKAIPCFARLERVREVPALRRRRMAVGDTPELLAHEIEAVVREPAGAEAALADERASDNGMACRTRPHPPARPWPRQLRKRRNGTIIRRMTNPHRPVARVNARLAPDDAKKLDYLSKREGKSVSGIIRDALRRYYREVRAREAVATGLLDRSGFVGCGEAESDLSTTYKRHLADLLLRKHGDR